jgi:voltage-gated potassium channel
MTPPTQTSPARTRNAAPARPGKALLRSGLFRFSVRRFLVALVLLLAATPIIEDLKEGAMLETGLATLVVCMGVLAIGARRRTLVLAVFLVVPAIGVNWAHHIWPDRHLVEAGMAFRLIFLVFVIANLLGFILRAPRVNSEVLCAGIASYLLLGVIWAIAYRLLAALNPEAFAFSVPPAASHTMTRFNAIYFSYITLTTVGYGDITPVSNVARMLALTEAMSGTLFVGMLIARLVSLYSAHGPVETAENRPKPLATASGTSYDEPRREEIAPDDQPPIAN